MLFHHNVSQRSYNSLKTAQGRPFITMGVGPCAIAGSWLVRSSNCVAQVVFLMLVNLRVTRRSGFEPWPRTLCFVLGQDTLLSQSVSQTSCYGSWEKLRPDGPLVWEWDVLRWLKDKWNYVVGKEEIWNYLNDFSRSYNRSSFLSLRNEDKARTSLIFRELSFFPLSFALVISLLIFVILRGWETFLDIDILISFGSKKCCLYTK